MPTPPIPHPTPFTCPNCGAGLQTRAEFCPHCGTRMETETKAARSIGWYAGTIGLAIATLAFGGVGACSAWVGGSVLLAGSGDYLAPMLLIINGPLLLIGAIGAWKGIATLIKRFRA